MRPSLHCFFARPCARISSNDSRTHSTEVNDRGVKFEDYADHGVQEYWLVAPTAEVLEQCRLVQGVYELVMKLGTGEVTSLVLPGFEIPVRAIFDERVNRGTLQAILIAENDRP